MGRRRQRFERSQMDSVNYYNLKLLRYLINIPRVSTRASHLSLSAIYIYIHGSLCSRCARMINIVTYVWRNDSGLRIKAYLVALKSNDYRSGSEFLFFLILNSLILTFCESNHREARPLCLCACATNAAHAASRQTRTRAIIYLSRRYCLW